WERFRFLLWKVRVVGWCYGARYDWIAIVIAADGDRLQETVCFGAVLAVPHVFNFGSDASSLFFRYLDIGVDSTNQRCMAARMRRVVTTVMHNQDGTLELLGERDG